MKNMNDLTYTESLFLRFPTRFTGQEIIILTLLELSIWEMIELKPVQFFTENPSMSFVKHHWVKRGNQYVSSSDHPHLDIFLKALGQDDFLRLSDFVYKIHVQIASTADFKNRWVYKPLMGKGYFVNLPFFWNLNVYLKTAQGRQMIRIADYSPKNGVYQHKLLQMFSNLGVEEARLKPFHMYEIESEIESGLMEPLGKRIGPAIDVDKTGFPIAKNTWKQ
jgi:hypothetical protein